MLESPLPTQDLNVFAQRLPRKHVLVLIDWSTLGTSQSHSTWISKRQLKIQTHCDLNPQYNRHSDFVTLSGNLALYCAASAKHDDFLIANDNAELWFLVMLLLHLQVCNTLIQLVEDNTPASLGLLRTVANFFKTLNRQASFLKQTNIPNAQMNFGSFVVQFQSYSLGSWTAVIFVAVG